MSESSQGESQEKTEEPTPKKREQSKKKGQAPRSKEFSTSMILLTSSIALIVMGKDLGSGLSQLIQRGLVIDRKILYSGNEDIIIAVGSALGNMFDLIIPFMLVLLVAAIVTPMLIGGWAFSAKSALPKFNKINPMKGLKRIFSVKGLMELVKSIAKVALIGSVAVFFIFHYISDLLALGSLGYKYAIFKSMEIIGWLFLLLSVSTLLIAAIDVPFQIVQHNKQLKMSKQEIKDEHKSTEGDPEVKGRIRQVQQEMSNKRMMEEVPMADVVVTNPTHFAIALKYDTAGAAAPIVVAKGADLISFRIREVAKKNSVPIFEAPLLARALYFTTEVNREIPHGLYFAVAQILAYIFQLRDINIGSKPPKKPRKFDIPDEFVDLVNKRHKKNE